MNPLSKRRTSGFTLLELIIVLAVMIAVAAMSLPLLQRSFSGQKLDKGADLVRAHMGLARVSAIRTGEIYAFYYQVEGPAFRVGPFNAETVDSMKGVSLNEETRSSNFDFGDDLLPRDVRFSMAVTNTDARAAAAMVSANFQPGDMRPLLFYPDGTSQTAKVILQNQENDAVQVTLRGLTGTTTVKKILDDRMIE
ncbi:MAG: prepilin-type N-terminal cleavage/methylation domain-containing protein [Mariniblastus sp.]|nr:prepilin-type N-terminal cleavage/methylation domain-containing protein [Mariniblastus sp.]